MLTVPRSQVWAFLILLVLLVVCPFVLYPTPPKHGA